MDARDTSILDFIGGKNISFIIPPFQRNYEWNESQCSELYDDVKSAVKNGREHYLGNIVYYVSASNASFREYILVDGQQRFTTVMLLLCAIRDLSGDEKLINNINTSYLKHDESRLMEGEEEYRIRLKQTSNDYDDFLKVIDKNQIDEYSSSNIINNYLYFKRTITEDLENKSIESLKDVYDAIEKLQIVKVDLEIQDNLEEVQLIFEKINSTGKPLSFTDLIRNFLLISKKSQQQDKLFKKYWKKIEADLGPDLLEPFMSCYLVYKIKDDIKSTDKYKRFKEFFKSYDKEQVLNEMLLLEKYYCLIKNCNTTNNKLNEYLKMQKLLKAQDMEPILLYTFSALYEQDRKKLLRIVKLYTDFMLRYRIVSPSGGGKALTTSLLHLLKKMTRSPSEQDYIPTEYDEILFVLSNSSTDGGRYPDNEEFKNSLMNTKLNIAYARVCLMRIEEEETKNIPVAIEEVTVEHLLPQTKTEWWVNNLGGDDCFQKTYSTFLNCIGNLTPVSGSYNSVMSNKPWDKKIKALSEVQFNITKEIATTYEKSWTETELIQRNESISDRACAAITAPKERTIPTKVAPVEQDEVILFSDLDTELDNSFVTSFMFDDEQYEVNTWRGLLQIVCEKMFEINPVLFGQVVENNDIHKSTYKHREDENDPIITSDKSLVNSPLEVKGSEYFIEAQLSSKRVRVYSQRLLEIFKVLNKCSYTIYFKD